ncbi:MAG: hypothetical protein XD91_0964 [Clostridiales bacterium 38_11]|nr:MAG: hypothetical protein XD91_0964 [Clostridiales bacterium 38_11]
MSDRFIDKYSKQKTGSTGNELIRTACFIFLLFLVYYETINHHIMHHAAS